MGLALAGAAAFTALSPDVGGTVRNVTAEVHVDPRGVIRTLDAEWVRSTDGRTFDFRFAVEEVGTSSVDRPDWVSEALNETG